MLSLDEESRLRCSIAYHLDAIRALFKAPDQKRITIVIRSPELDDGDVVLTDDDTRDAIAAIRRLGTDGAGRR